jgi:hypothetical protein
MNCIGDGRRVSRLIAGALLLLLGGLFVLQNFGLVRAGDLGDYWPLLLVWVGLTRMLAPNRGRYFASGLLIFLLGAFFQLDRLDVIRFPVRQFWPFVLIGGGLALIVDALVARRGGGGIAAGSQAESGGRS